MSNQRKITEDDISVLKYFWFEKGRLDGNSSFDQVKEDLKKSHPEIWKAWKDYKKSKEIFNNIMKNI